MTLPIEELWKDIPGYEGYYRVSNRGRVEAVTRLIVDKYGKSRILRGRFLNGAPRDGVYNHVCLSKHGQKQFIGVHRLVLMAFVRLPRGNEEGHHFDGNPANNDVHNLRWGTYQDNANDRSRHGRTAQGERNGTAKLTATKIQEIRSDPRSQNDLARAYGVSQTTISRILLRTRGGWKHVSSHSSP